jgi:hypothetical protein
MIVLSAILESMDFRCMQAVSYWKGVRKSGTWKFELGRSFMGLHKMH